jgi:hypothetical protein
VAGAFYSLGISNWHGFSKGLNAIVKSGEKEFMKVLFGKKGVHFSAKKCCRKCAKSHAKKNANGGAILSKKICQ